MPAAALEFLPITSTKAFLELLDQHGLIASTDIEHNTVSAESLVNDPPIARIFQATPKHERRPDSGSSSPKREKPLVKAKFNPIRPQHEAIGMKQGDGNGKSRRRMSGKEPEHSTEGMVEIEFTSKELRGTMAGDQHFRSWVMHEFEGDTTWNPESEDLFKHLAAENAAPKPPKPRVNLPGLGPKRPRNPLPFPRSLLAHIHTLRLVNRRIEVIDAGGLLEQMKGLRELSLNGNRIERVDNVPARLEVLCLNANLLAMCPNLGRHENLLHVGLACNRIGSLNSVDSHDACAKKPRGGIPTQLSPLPDRSGTVGRWIPRSLVSLDLSYNNLCDLGETLDLLRAATSTLRILTLMGNPLSLVKGYRSIVIASISSLVEFDDTVVTESEKRASNGLDGAADKDRVNLFLKLWDLTGLEPPPTPTSDSEAPPPIYKDRVEISFARGMSEFKLSTTGLEWTPTTQTVSDGTNAPPIPAGLSKKEREAREREARERDTIIVMTPSPLEFERMEHLPIGIDLRDCFIAGVQLTVVRERFVHVTRPPSAEHDVPKSGKSRAGSAGKGGGKKAEKKPAGKGGKGKKGGEDDADRWVQALDESKIIGSYVVPAKDFLCGVTHILGAYTLSQENSAKNVGEVEYEKLENEKKAVGSVQAQFILHYHSETSSAQDSADAET
ncbi:hypothetical protein BJ742DRAFT_874045 [Cladochytrium replicatum]|nr:hypothetical protein BJ742DRAFT_874045 [Cladochytrium replicatum]